MTIKIIHISDIHYRSRWEEDEGLVLDEFFKDLKTQLNGHPPEHTYLATSGDITRAGSCSELYHKFVGLIKPRLKDLGLTKQNMIIVPGNHDVSQQWIQENLINHNGVITQKLDEKEFNDYIESDTFILNKKFECYSDFERDFAGFGVGNGTCTGEGHDLNESIGVYCLNTSISSSGKSSSDNGNLTIDTRSIHKWIAKNKTRSKIMVMHHPLSWLNKWSRIELKKILENHFILVLFGHEHDQSVYHKNNINLLEVSAPPLFTSKNNNLGYSVISISASGSPESISYRQWSPQYSFVSGVNFSNNDSGVVSFLPTTQQEVAGSTINIRSEVILHDLKNKLSQSLVSFLDQPKVWITPTLYNESEDSDRKKDPTDETDETEQEKFSTPVNEVINSNSSFLISSPPQFGLTCTANYLCLSAYEQKGELWITLDAEGLKPDKIKRKVDEELLRLSANKSQIQCIILDSWNNHDTTKIKLLKKLSKEYPEIKLVIMKTMGANIFSTAKAEEEVCERPLTHLFLHSLSREEIRSVVSQYNNTADISDENILLQKIASDLETLNLHRTVLNCITLLKVSEVDFDDSPVNRTEVIKKVLFLLFNTDRIATYKRRPDIKDCEHALGWFCEKMLRDENLIFTREHFLHSINQFCTSNIIDLDTHVLFDILANNNIIIKRGNEFSFRFTYWIMYFAAQRMHHNSEFREFIFSNMRYATFPELMEYYTGIDRRRDDALDVLINDLDTVYNLVSDKIGFPEDLDIYKLAKWSPSAEAAEMIQEEISSSIQSSNLPVSVKDQYADRSYSAERPYDQNLREVTHEFSLDLLIQVLSAGSRAVRNSDYASPEKKQQSLKSITKCWDLISKVLIVIAPILAENGRAQFEGAGFHLDRTLRRLKKEDRFQAILHAIPENIIRMFSTDLYSPKMGPLFFNQIKNETSDLQRHYLALTVVNKRPYKWKENILPYINSVHKNSFYLCNLESALHQEQKYSFCSETTQQELIDLRKTTWQRHVPGKKRRKIPKFRK